MTRAKKKGESKTAPRAKVPPTPTSPAPPLSEKTRHGLGALGRQSLTREVPALVLSSQAPAQRKSPAPSPSSRPTTFGSVADGASDAVLIYLRDELRALLSVLDEPPPAS